MMQGMQPIPVPAADGEDIEMDDAMAKIQYALNAGLTKRGYNINDLLNTLPSSDQELAAQWVRCTILPEDTIDTPLRYKSPSNQYPSAALAIRDFKPVKWQFQPNIANAQMGPGDMGVFTFDDNPLDIVHIYDPNPFYGECVYDWQFNSDPIIRWTQGGGIRANKAIVNLADPENVDFHGLYLYTQYDRQDNRYFWVDCKPGSVDSTGAASPSTIEVEFPAITAAPPTFLFTVGLYRFFGGTPKLCAQAVIDAAIPLTGTGGCGKITFLLNNNTTDPANGLFPTYSDYYTVRIAYARSRTATVDANFAAASAAILGGTRIRSRSRMSVLRHIAAKEIEFYINAMSEKGRINAMALRLTDVPMLQYQNGLISGFVCLNGNSWYQYWQHGLQLGDNFYQRVSTAVGARIHEIWKGGYMWHKSADETNYFWQKWMSWDETTRQPSDMGVNLETTRPVNIMAMNATNDFTAGNPNGGGCIAAATWALHVEWISPISSWPARVSEYTTQACQMGIDAAGKFPSFVENDAHWDKFLAYSAQVADHGMPLWSALIKSGANKLGQLTNQRIGNAVGALAQKGVRALAGMNKKRK